MAVVADMIEGVVVTNQLAGVEAGQCRALLWDEIASLEEGSVDGVAAAGFAAAEIAAA
jgi:hypothetical protein